MTVDQHERGLYGKFRVERVDGRDQPGGDRSDAFYFVLDIVHDDHARWALAAYEESCRASYPDLATDLRKVLAQAEQRDRDEQYSIYQRIIGALGWRRPRGSGRKED